jgi:hypothetical protein
VTEKCGTLPKASCERYCKFDYITHWGSRYMDKANRFHSILVEILRLGSVQLLLQNNHNLVNQNWNKMVGRPAAAAGSGSGSGLILGDRQAQGACWDKYIVTG